MQGTTFHTLVALVAFVGVLLLLTRGGLALRSRRRSRLPRRLEWENMAADDLPSDAREPLAFLTDKLSSMGFQAADLPAFVPSPTRRHRLMLVPFVHPEEHAYFLMGIEAGLTPKTQLVLHIVSPLAEDRRVETSTLAVLEELPTPAGVHAQIVLDADSVSEIWARHRRALADHRRQDRLPASAEEWRVQTARAYQGWVQSAVRAQRLQLDTDQDAYRVRARPKSTF